MQSVADLATTALHGLSVINQQQSDTLRDMRAAVNGMDQSTIGIVERFEIDLKRYSIQLLWELESSLRNLKDEVAVEVDPALPKDLWLIEVRCLRRSTASRKMCLASRFRRRRLKRVL